MFVCWCGCACKLIKKKELIKELHFFSFMTNGGSECPAIILKSTKIHVRLEKSVLYYL